MGGGADPPPEEALCFAVAAEHVDDLMGHHVLDGFARGLEVLTRVEMIRVLVEILPDAGGVF